MSKTATKPAEAKLKPAETKSSTAISCRVLKAAAVCVAGTFNDWNPTSTPLIRQADGTWTVTLDLPPGRYEYKFVVDGEWCCAPGCEEPHNGCPKCVPNSFGTMNRFVEVT